MKDRIMAIGEAGIQAVDEKTKVLMNNMVNAKTPAFRKSGISVKSFPLELQSADQRLYSSGSTSMLPKVEGTFYNHIQGALVRTGNDLDLSIGGKGFFVLSLPWGDGYSRDGRFYINEEGILSTIAGKHQVMGKSGPIVIAPGSRFDISTTGEIKVDDIIVDQIRIVEFDNPGKLESINGTIFRDRNNELNRSEIDVPRIIQGYAEASNVNIIDEMMEVIYLSRLYTINTKIVSTRDAELTKALNIGSVQ